MIGFNFGADHVKMSDGSTRYRPFIQLMLEGQEHSFIADFTIPTEDQAREFAVAISNLLQQKPDAKAYSREGMKPREAFNQMKESVDGPTPKGDKSS